MSAQFQPRHIASNANGSDLGDLPIPLQGRLKLQIINEAPPGVIPENYPRPKTYERLSVYCGPEKNICVDINYVYYVSKYIFKREGEDWYICHTWTRTWEEGSHSGTFFVNLNTGEHYETYPLFFWRGSLNISPNGMLGIIEGGIIASSARKLYIIDLSMLPNIPVLHYEENWDSESSACFLENSQIEFNYGFSKKQFEHDYLGNVDSPKETRGWPTPKKQVIVVREKNPEDTVVQECNFLKNYTETRKSDIESTKYLVQFGVHDLIDISETVEDAVNSDSDSSD
jgi:hypothetical protein